MWTYNKISKTIFSFLHSFYLISSVHILCKNRKQDIAGCCYIIAAKSKKR